MSRPGANAVNPHENRDIGDLATASDERRKAERGLSMSERLAQVHVLSRQMSAIKGAARAR
jgi:hypothetical protein